MALNFSALAARRNLLPLFFVVVLSSYFCLWRIGVPVMDHHDETIHANVVLSMYETSDFLNPIFRGAPYLNKPPFKMWLSVGALHLFGVNEFAFRVVDGLAGVGTIIITYLLCLHLFSSSLSAVFAALFLMGSKGFLFKHMVRCGTQDSMLVFLSAIAMFFLWKIYEKWQREEWPPLRNYLCAGIAIGLAVLTKSVAGSFVPCTFLLFLLLTMRSRLLEKRVLGALCVIFGTAFLVFAPWYGRQIFLYSHGLSNFLEIPRLVTPPHGAGNWYLYVDYLFSGAVIPKIFIPISVTALAYVFWSESARRSPIIFLISWGVGLLAVLTVLPSRVSHYLAPGYPAFAIMAGYSLRMLFLATIHSLYSQRYLLKATAIIPITLILFSSIEMIDDIRRSHLRINRKTRTPIAHHLVEFIKSELAQNSPLALYVFDDLLNSRYDYTLYSRLMKLEYKEMSDENMLPPLNSNATTMILTRRKRVSLLRTKMPNSQCIAIHLAPSKPGRKSRKKRTIYILHNFPLSREYRFAEDCVL